MESNNVESPEKPIAHRRIRRQVPLRIFVVGVMAVAIGTFAWNRTGGDYLLSALLVGLTTAVMDIRVSDSGRHGR